MELKEPERRIEEPEGPAPSRDFITAVAELLEMDPEDILTEMGYEQRHEPELVSLR
ncbi:MAG: hypothetical protein KGJ62_00685 [Armatimonadetes bacterium]|nr:hypothetical protein [Armatimonadota bacterium]MDE2205141.1 hypothetical protein [Armatimonadota bacterium]